MTTRAEVNRLARAQDRLIRSASADLSGLFSQLDLSRPDSARDGLLELYPALAIQRGDVAAALSAEWYEETRRAQVGGTYAAELPPSISEERSRQTVRWAAGALYTESPLSSLGLLDGSLVRTLGDASRDTISLNATKDRRSVGWSRITQAGACDFCLVLSQRGAVYKKASATFASHDNCKCSAAPSFDRGAREVEAGAYQASERTSGMSPAQKERHQRTTREWMESQQWKLDDFRAANE